MKKLILLISLIAIGHSQDTYDCIDTQVIQKQICESIKINGKNVCAYSGSSCTEDLAKCEDYNPSSGFSDNTCTSINPSDIKYKCVVQTKNSVKSCVKELKECSEYATANNCIDLEAGNGKRCVWYNGICKAHKDECTGLTQTECADNIPKSNTKKCKWESGSCSSVDRYCEEHISYSDKYGGSNVETCPNLKVDPSKLLESFTCVYSSVGGCSSYFKSCDIANDAEEYCESITPLNEQRTDFDYLHKCTYSNSKCLKVEKKCLESDDNQLHPETCYYLQTSNNNKMCVLDTSKWSRPCKEEYITCDSYNKDITDSKKRDSTTCENITPKDPKTKEEDPHSECYLNSDSCVIRKKECNKLDYSICNSHVFDDSSKSDKRCLYTGTECKEIYKTCSAYNALEASKKNKEDCEIIESTDEQNSIAYKCVFNSETKACTKEQLHCDKYKGKIETECAAHKPSIDGNKCGIGLDGNCQEIYKNCEQYTGTDSDTCTSIELEDKTSKCVMKSNSCKSEKKVCSDAKYPAECNAITPTDSDKQCAFIGNCVEQYKTCELYESKVTSGKNKNDCESIILKSDSTKKCQFSSNSQCTTVYKSCQEVFASSHTLQECSTLSSTYNNNKEKCVFDSSKLSCSIKDKTCLEMETLSGATEDDCKNAVTSSSNKVCSVKTDKTGCEEVEKENSANINNLSKIIIVLLALLF